MADVNSDETFDDFWRELVCPNGEWDFDAVKAELHDYRTLLREVSVVYQHVTGDAISKPNTSAADVIAMADEYAERQLRERVNEMVSDHFGDPPAVPGTGETQ